MSADYGPPGLTTVFHDGRRRDWRFVGSTDASRNPIGLLRGAAELLASLSEDSVVLMPESRNTPVSRQTNLALAELVQPTEIHVPRDSDISSITRCSTPAWFWKLVENPTSTSGRSSPSGQGERHGSAQAGSPISGPA